MVWIDSVVSVGDDYKMLKGRCRILLSKEHLSLTHDQKVWGSSAIEYTAQAYGYLKAAYQVIHDFKDPPQRTFLAGVRRAESFFSRLPKSETQELFIDVEVIKDLRPIVFVRGIISAQGQLSPVATAEIQVFFE